MKVNQKKNNQKANNMGTAAIISLILGLLGVVTSIGVTAFNKRTANEQLEKQFQLNEQAAENSDERTRALYNDFESPMAQIEQLKKAGLSPSLFYSGGSNLGGATATGAMGNGGGGVQTPMMSMGSPRELAETALLQAQTKKVQEETKTMAGDNVRGQTEIQSMLQQISTNLSQQHMNEANKELTNAKTAWQNVTNEIQSQTKDASIDTILHNARLAELNAKYVGIQAEREGLKFQFDGEMLKAQLDKIKVETNNLIADTKAKFKGMELTDAQIQWTQAKAEEVYNNIIQRWQEIDISERNWKTYSKLVDAEVAKFQAEKDAIPEKLRIAEEGAYFGLAGSIIGSAAHLAGVMIAK